jgi:hypothetical protein
MCECVNKFNEKLASHNGRIAMALTMSKDLSEMRARLLVQTEKIDKSKRKPIPAVMASYCPFCGEKDNERQ